MSQIMQIVRRPKDLCCGDRVIHPSGNAFTVVGAPVWCESEFFAVPVAWSSGLPDTIYFFANDDVVVEVVV